MGNGFDTGGIGVDLIGDSFLGKTNDVLNSSGGVLNKLSGTLNNLMPAIILLMAGVFLITRRTVLTQLVGTIFLCMGLVLCLLVFRSGGRF